MYQFTEEDYENKFGHPLSSKMELEEVNGFISTVASLIYLTIRVDEGDETEYQQGRIIEAQVWQAKYMVDNGFLPGMSGYDPFTNTMVGKGELEKRYISPMTHAVLLRAGLLYRGVA